MLRLFELLLVAPPSFPTLHSQQTFFTTLNATTTRLLAAHHPRHRVSRLAPCHCTLCRYTRLLPLATAPPFPTALGLPRKTPTNALHFLPPTLRALSLANTTLTECPAAPHLVALDISSSPLFDAIAAHLTAFAALRHLTARSCQVNDAALAALHPLPLRTLDVAANLLTPRCLAALAETPLARALAVLDLSNNALDRAALPLLLALPTVALVRLKGCKIDQRALKAFVARHPALRYAGMDIARGRPPPAPAFPEPDGAWGRALFLETLAALGAEEFRAQQTDAMATSRAVIVTRPPPRAGD